MKKIKARCKQDIPDGGQSFHYHQCRRIAVKDGYCKQHHPDAARARQAARSKRADARWKNSDFKKLQRATEAIIALTEALEKVRDVCRTTGPDLPSGEYARAQAEIIAFTALKLAKEPTDAQ